MMSYSYAAPSAPPPPPPAAGPPAEAAAAAIDELAGRLRVVKPWAWQLRDAKSHALTATAAKGTAAYSAAEAGVRYERMLTSLTDLQRPVEKISLPQYAALTLTGFIFTFYGLFVTPINYALTGVNILLFASSGWHLARKLKACITWGECDVEDAPPATL